MSLCRYDLYSEDVAAKAKELAIEHPEMLDEAPYFYPSFRQDGWGAKAFVVSVSFLS